MSRGKSPRWQAVSKLSHEHPELFGIKPSVAGEAGYDLTVEISSDLPAHAVYVTLDGKDLRVRVSPRVEAEVLAAALHPQVATAVAEAMAAQPPVPGRDQGD